MPTLQLLPVRRPGQASLSVSIYDTAQDAWKHLQNHVLTAPECEAWAVVHPELLEVVDLHDANARWQFGQQVNRSESPDAPEGTAQSLQHLYDRYAVAVQEAANSADRLGWHVCHQGRRVTVALGINGVLQIYRKALKTAFLPGHGNAYETLAARRENRLRRDAASDSLADSIRGMRAGRTPSERAVAREQRRRQAHVAEQSLDQKRYYVFRKAVQTIRSDNRAALNSEGTAHSTADYALLKAVLPPMSKLRLSDWLSYYTGGAN